MIEHPEFDELYGEVTLSSSGWIYFERVSVGENEEPHDVVEPRLSEAREVIAAAGYVIDDETGCDHDSLWVYFKRAPDSASATSEG